MNSFSNSEYEIQVTHYWTTATGVSVSGWVRGKRGPLDSLTVAVGPYFAKANPLGDPDAEGRQKFIAYVPHKRHTNTIFYMERRGKTETVEGVLEPTPPHERPHLPRRDLWPMFLKAVNYRKLSVLEIGSRFVDPATTKEGRRPLIDGEYVGFDYHPGPNVDVVGDAHLLSTYFDRQFGAVISSSVLEHIAMPWLVAIEINRVLEMGGITYHYVPLMWPLHELPWDFFRYSVGGLQAIFSPPLGFQVLDVAYGPEVQTYFADGPTGNDAVHHHHPLGASFASASIVAKKVANVDLEKTRWNVVTEEMVDSIYPEPK